MSQLQLANILAGSGNVLAGGDNTGNVTKITLGTNLSISGGVLNAASGSTISLTTTGNSGASTFISNVLNVPTYSLTGLGGVPTTRTLTINGTTYDLSADRSWTIAGGVTSFNTRTGAISLISGDVTTALGFTPYNSSNPNNYISLSALTAGSPLNYNSSTGVFTITQADSTHSGYLSATDWTNFNNKLNTLTLTTSGSSGAATYVGSTLNIPNYTLAGLGGQPALSGTGFVKIIGTTISYDNSSYITLTNLSGGTGISYNGATGVISSTITQYSDALARAAISVNAPLSYNSTTGVISIPNADATHNGYLSSSDWITFNSKSVAISFSTSGSSGAATYNSTTGAMNIPNYTLSGLGGQPQLNGIGLVKMIGTSVSYDNNPYITLTNLSAGAGLSYNGATGQFSSTITQYTDSNARSSISVNAPITYNSTTGVIGITYASATTNGYISSSDWITFNSKGNPISLSTSGSSGAATYNSGTGALNIPNYTLSGLGGQSALSGTGFVKISGTTISYDNSTYYLASNPSGYITSSALSSYLPLTGGTLSGSLTATSFYESSDGRLKNVLYQSKSDNITTINFKWKNQNKNPRWGYIAQEVEEYLPYAVENDENGFMKVDYNQVHTWKIAQLEAKIAELEKRLNA